MSRTDSMNRLHAAIRWIPALVWMAFIFALSSLSRTGLPSGASGPAHFGAYAVLGALCILAMGRWKASARAVGYAVLISSAYGITDEIHQSFVPGRVPDVVDWGLDTLGSLAGALAMLALWSLLSRRAPGEPG